MLLVLGENSFSGGYSRNLPFSKQIEKSGLTLNQWKCSWSSPSLFSQIFATEEKRENVNSGSLSSCKNFPWEKFVLAHRPLSSEGYVFLAIGGCFCCLPLCLLMNPQYRTDAGKCLLAKHVWLDGRVQAWKSKNMENHRSSTQCLV